MATELNTVERVVDYIRLNRVSSTEVADCLGKTGALDGVLPINAGLHAVGPVHVAIAHGASNWGVHESIEHVLPGSVVVIEAVDCEDRAIVGDLVAKYVTLYRQASALVVNGRVRDVPRLRREGWPVWSRGVSPVGCANEKPDESAPSDWVDAVRLRYHGSIAVCDDSGVVIIPGASVDADLVDRLDRIERQEDVWYQCIDQRKWSTFETVCLKRYLDVSDSSEERRPSRP